MANKKYAFKYFEELTYAPEALSMSGNKVLYFVHKEKLFL